MEQLGEGHTASRWSSGDQSLRTASRMAILPTLCCWPSGVLLALWELWGDQKKPEKQGCSSPSAHPRRGAGWHRAGTHLSHGWAGTGPGRLAFSSVACSRCHGGLQEGRGEDPWTQQPLLPSLRQGRTVGPVTPPRDLEMGVGEAKGTYQNCSALQGRRASPVSASCPRRSCLFRRYQGHTE